MAPPETKIVEIAASYEGMPYASPPYAGSFDCSSYALQVYKDAGLPLPAGVRTAEQIRQACTLIPFEAIAEGDLVFWQHTYIPADPPGPDGYTASHVAISLGPGTGRCWSAQDPAVKEIDITTSYWMPKLISVGRWRA